MAGESEHPSSGGSASGGNADPAAVALALGQGGKLDPRAAAYLEKQSRLSDEQLSLTAEQIALTRLQAEDLRREDRIRHWSLRVRHVSDVMKLAFEVCIAVILITVVVFLGAAIWTATSDNSLIIDAFNVPEDMGKRGLTGQVVAAQLQDKLSAMQAATDSARPAASYANNWGDDIKVEIPNTGVSIGEFYRYLAKWLGNQTHITGEVFRTPSGAIAVTARTGDDSATVTGPDADFDKLIQQAAEKIYERTQPYRYAVFLQEKGTQASIDGARAVLQRLLESGSRVDRTWAYIELANLDSITDPVRAPDEVRRAIALDPELGLAEADLSLYEGNLGHDEIQLVAARAALPLLGASNGEMTERGRRVLLVDIETAIAQGELDAEAGIARSHESIAFPSYEGNRESAREAIVTFLALRHEPAASRAAYQNLPAAGDPFTPALRATAALTAAYWSSDWTAILVQRPTAEKLIRDLAGLPGAGQKAVDLALAVNVWPEAATALAMTGDFAGANALIAKTPLDCYICVRARGDIAAAEKEWKAADTWFVRTVHDGPSLPAGYSDWGRSLMARGDLDGAIAKFEQANEKGPHWADPLEAWGEVLLAQHHADDAAEKFEAANEFAPRWGRLHLKWGEALLANGDRDEANKQFALAAPLDLSTDERAELARARGVPQLR